MLSFDPNFVHSDQKSLLKITVELGDILQPDGASIDDIISLIDKEICQCKNDLISVMLSSILIKIKHNYSQDEKIPAGSISTRDGWLPCGSCTAGINQKGAMYFSEISGGWCYPC